ncbi:helix-turn-helix domain-containing protein [Oceanobacillus alkalisoli]|uniref:helix-turn-helix domain-containing protein n=1 Tax=Oceanobacillus alkalisoli TaxID=2925113 RepID=UPI001F11A3C6|nr:helix-turn-helix domain-containing protein [Oceanobacillus alkalisoli]MCF3942929.1 helix-turn-helix domain-containing protein [Oceanobacillus alkalisoli]
MTRLIDLTKKVQKYNDAESLEIVLTLFEPKIRASLKETSPQEQTDLYQELKIRVIEIIRKYDYNNTYGFWEFTNRLKEQHGTEHQAKENSNYPVKHS